jgi:hypothetical protein
MASPDLTESRAGGGSLAAPLQGGIQILTGQNRKSVRIFPSVSAQEEGAVAVCLVAKVMSLLG